ncbi:hypothetical protein CC78DRAFT_580648 [Lojkania enalia]|uniref:Protein kinase domain-containing protein n=1 Tax=Lojkania enalia TaxID=147567 RepID=A0A9P4K7Q1_9PLEO|nr:hypothetical protein CC78DRAFT_580648 [Didymosphaeria enalia]
MSTLVERMTWFYKQVLVGDVGMTITKLATYANIYAAELGEDVGVPRLLSVVEDEQILRIIGLQLLYTDCKNKTISFVAQASERILHDKWLKHIIHSLKEFHAHQIVWGEVKADNVLIDMHEGAYLIHFGGGYTNGLVDKDLMNTQEGDS